MGSEQTLEYYDKYFLDKKDYQKLHYREFSRYPLWNQVYKFLSKYSPDLNTQILEVGCGTGQLAYLLWDCGYRNYTGTDFSPVAIQMCWEFCSQHFELEDCKLSLINRKFDVCIAVEILEHIQEDLDLLKLIPAGKKIIFGVPKFDAKSHVRHFPKLKNVTKRYGSLINILEVKELSKWFFVIGEKLG